jgi:DNA repair protein RecO (recombination protein O)
MKSIHHGILLKRVNYSESSLVLTFYTKENGTQNYLFQGGKKKKGNLLQPLSVIEINTYKRSESNLGKISEISAHYVPQTIPFHPVKSGVAFFIAETLYGCLKSHDEDKRVFEFLCTEIEFIDNNDISGNYMIWFLLNLSRFLGFHPDIEEENPKILIISEGVFRASTPLGSEYILHEGIPQLAAMTTMKKNDALKLKLNKTERKNNLNTLITYYKYHVEGFQTPKSLSILQTIFE